ncbi:RGCVC family protein [Labedaea rhizosphaerae]|uniref:RGCVC family protein n=1 Tax=Labedaea rhizosphaerae TaxID=598644 RepID=UPI00105FF23F|nr:RGCVC family protein [Labedaea rhizosphaerae]
MDRPVTRHVPEVTAAADRAPGTCETCSHPWSNHDPISVRFCTATLNGGYSRACVCSTKETG